MAKITMTKFINGLDLGKIPKSRASEDPLLTEAEKKEYGCLQWASTQCRPEIAPAISLSNQGQETTISSLKTLYDTLHYLKSAETQGILFQDIPFTKETVILAFSDASWANASRSGSQVSSSASPPPWSRESHRSLA